MTVIAALRKWITEIEAAAGDGEIPTSISASYIVVKEELEKYDAERFLFTEFDRAYLKALRIAA